MPASATARFNLFRLICIVLSTLVSCCIHQDRMASDDVAYRPAGDVVRRAPVQELQEQRCVPAFGFEIGHRPAGDEFLDALAVLEGPGDAVVGMRQHVCLVLQVLAAEDASRSGDNPGALAGSLEQAGRGLLSTLDPAASDV